MQTNKLLRRLLTGLFVLTLTCTSLAAVAQVLSIRLFVCCTASVHHGTLADVLPDMLLPVALGVWFVAAGTWTVVRRVVRTHLHARRLLRQSQAEHPTKLADVLAEYQLENHVVLVRARHPLAFCFGFVRPRICLSTGLVALLPSSQLKAVLLHEAYHRRRFDPLRLLCAEAVGTMLFFLPVVHEWRDTFTLQLELDADRHTINAVGKPALAGALHRLLAQPPSSVTMPAAGVAGLSPTAARIAELLGDGSPPQQISSHTLLRSTIVLAVTCLLLML